MLLLIEIYRKQFIPTPQINQHDDCIRTGMRDDARLSTQKLLESPNLELVRAAPAGPAGCLCSTSIHTSPRNSRSPYQQGKPSPRAVGGADPSQRSAVPASGSDLGAPRRLASKE